VGLEVGTEPPGDHKSVTKEVAFQPYLKDEKPDEECLSNPVTRQDCWEA
jgi:hypothetical protein